MGDEGLAPYVDRARTSQALPEAETPLPAYTSHAQHTFTRTTQLHKDGR